MHFYYTACTVYSCIAHAEQTTELSHCTLHVVYREYGTVALHWKLAAQNATHITFGVEIKTIQNKLNAHTL